MLPFLPTYSARTRGFARWTSVVVVACVGAWLGVSLWGFSTVPLGPVEARIEASVGPGRTDIELPPFGRISADSHVGPLTFSVSPVGMDLERLSDDLRVRTIPELTDEIETGVRDKTTWFALRLVGVAAAGTLGLSLIAFRGRARWVGASMLLTVVLAASSLLVAQRTYDTRAFEEPTFSGTLSVAPQLIGSARQVATTIEDFRVELRRIVSGAVRAYTHVEPRALGDTEEIRVLHISDIHSSPIGLDFAKELASGFDVDLVIDTGDITSYGTPFENSFVDGVRRIDRPYLFVRGNHDSSEVEAAVEALPNAATLDGRATTAAGLTVYGLGHPVFTEDKTDEVDHPTYVERAEAAGSSIIADLVQLKQRPDIVAVHDDRMAAAVKGLAPLVLSGHFHDASMRSDEGTTFLRAGSAGGAGVNVFERSEGVPLSAQVLYFSDAEPNRLLAYDQIAQEPVTGRLVIDRHIVRRTEADRL